MCQLKYDKQIKHNGKQCAINDQPKNSFPIWGQNTHSLQNPTRKQKYKTIFFTEKMSYGSQWTQLKDPAP
jgi:hypothetical protein